MPRGLSDRAKRLWKAVADTYDLRADEWAVFIDAVHALTDADRLRAAMAKQPLVVKGSKGQDRAHPLLSEIRSSVTLASGLLRQLGLPDDPADTTQAARSHAGRELVSMRWRRGSAS